MGYLLTGCERPLTSRGFSRRSLLRLGAGAAAVAALTPILAACGGDGDDADAAEPAGDEDASASDDELTEALEQAEEETDIELDALDEEEDERVFPDDFPDDIPLPDDWQIITDLSADSSAGREIYIAFTSYEDRMTMLETYAEEIPANYEIDDEQINEEMEIAQWDFNGNGWEWARIQLGNPTTDDDPEFQVLVILRDYIH